MIPKKISMIYLQGYEKLPHEYKKNIEKLIEMNNGWEFHLYDEEDALEFISYHYDESFVENYLNISDLYPAARADFLRYLIIYIRGGVYLDVKSCADKPLIEVLDLEKDFIAFHWDNTKWSKYYNYGLHKELLSFSKYGELQQWNIICSEKNLLIKNVIENCVKNIKNYFYFRDGVGKNAVLRITGPICYTISILEKITILDKNKYDISVNHESVGLVFDTRKNLMRKVNSTHYTKIYQPLVNRNINKFMFYTWLPFYYVKDKIDHLLIKLKKLFIIIFLRKFR